jgi:hypothetical protein
MCFLTLSYSKSTDPNPSCEAASRLATQEFINILWISKVHYNVHKNPPQNPILSQINPTIPPDTISLRSILILSYHLRLGLPAGLFPYGFPTKILYAFVSSSMLAACCPPHLPQIYQFRLKVKVRRACFITGLRAGRLLNL